MRFTYHFPDWIYSTYKKDNKTKIIGLSGGQGSWKKYYYRNFKTYFKKKYGLELCIFSIDDFIKLSQREKNV